MNLTVTAIHSLLDEDDQKRFDSDLKDIQAGRDMRKRVDPRVAAVAQMMPMLGARRG